MDYCIFLSIFTSALSTFSVKQQPFSVLEFTAFELLSWCGYKRPFYRYGGHIELIRFKEYYRVPKGHEQDLIYSLCLYTRFSGQFFFTSFLEKGCNGKKNVIMIAFFPRNIQWSSLFAQKARVNTERVLPWHSIILLKSNKFNMKLPLSTAFTDARVF